MANKEILKDVPINELIPYDKNYLNHDNNREFIKNSIGTFDFTTPIEVDENMVILAGHGRLEAAKMLNMETIPFVLKISGWDDKKKTAYRYANNSSAGKAEIIFDNVEFDLDIIGDDYDLGDFGFDMKDLPQEDVVEDEAPPVPEIPKTVKGDIYELGNHRVMCGDSTIITDVEKLMDGQKADMYLSDPPYNVAYEGKTKDALTIQNDKMDNDSFRQFLKDAFANIDVHMKAGGVFYIWHADLEGYNFRGACFDIGWQVRQCLIWNKNTMVMGRQDYHWKHEPCLYGWKDGAGHLWATDRKQTTILSFERPTQSKEHPTMKPTALFAYQIQNNTKGDDIIVDNFLGSGTTVLACEQTNRKCYGIELDEKYCDVIVQRYVNFTGNTKIKLNGKEIEWSKSDG